MRGRHRTACPSVALAAPDQCSDYPAHVRRYASFLSAEAIARIFGTVNPLPNLALSWNVAPTQDAAVVRRHPDTGARHLDLLRWGLLPMGLRNRPRHSGRSTGALCCPSPSKSGKIGIRRSEADDLTCILVCVEFRKAGAKDPAFVASRSTPWGGVCCSSSQPR